MELPVEKIRIVNLGKEFITKGLSGKGFEITFYNFDNMEQNREVWKYFGLPVDNLGSKKLLDMEMIRVSKSKNMDNALKGLVSFQTEISDEDDEDKAREYISKMSVLINFDDNSIELLEDFEPDTYLPRGELNLYVSKQNLGFGKARRKSIKKKSRKTRKSGKTGKRKSGKTGKRKSGKSKKSGKRKSGNRKKSTRTRRH
jgi:hypothetical protein